MQFLYQPLTWGFLLIAVPILVHLINMLRHRRVQWAAMDFLLESYRRNRRWILLKQWLLLASRLLAMILLVAMLAKWISGSQWLSWIGGQTTHHYLLLDDSYSMAAVSENQTAYSRALQALGGLVDQISKRPGQHQITLLRWSRASLALRNSEAEARLDAAADLSGQSITQEPAKLLERINATSASSLSLAPEDPLELVIPLVSENAEQKSEVYLLTDMRRNEFQEPDELRNQLQALKQNDTTLHLIDCGETEDGNLSLISLEPEQDVWAAGVPLMIRFQVRNRTQAPVRNVVVRVRVINYPNKVVKPQLDQPYSGETRDEPAVVIEEIQPGETVTRQFQSLFSVPGNHAIEISLADDTLNADNRRWCSINIQESQRVLLVDGDVQQRNAFYFESVVSPNPRLSTGITVQKQDPSFLRDAAPAVLDDYDVIVLLDVPRIDPQAIQKLEQFVVQGGGLLNICGQNTNQTFVNEQLVPGNEDSASGLFPAPITSIMDITQDPNESEPQVAALDHPVLGPFLQLESSPFFQLKIRRIVELENVQNRPMEVVATGPQGRPLILDSMLGDGHILTMLTGLNSQWSNWPQDPTFVIFALRSFGYLGSFRRESTSSETGEAFEMIVTDETVLPDGEWLMPSSDGGIRVRLQRKTDQSDTSGVARMQLPVNLDEQRELLDTLLRPGLFESWMTTPKGDMIVKNTAHNVLSAEGSLERVSRSELEQNLVGVDLKIRSADAVSTAGLNLLDAEHSTLLMLLLGALMIGEQALAYSASYHSPVGGKSK